jgi:hypothetical protein
VFNTSRDLLPGVFNCLVKTALQQFHGREFGEIFTDANGFRVELEQFNLLRIGGRTENEAQRRFLGWCAFVLV